MGGVECDPGDAYPGVVTIDGEYYLQQFQPGQGVASLGVDDAQPPEQAKHSENVF